MTQNSENTNLNLRLSRNEAKVGMTNPPAPNTKGFKDTEWFTDAVRQNSQRYKWTSNVMIYITFLCSLIIMQKMETLLKRDVS